MDGADGIGARGRAGSGAGGVDADSPSAAPGRRDAGGGVDASPASALPATTADDALLARLRAGEDAAFADLVREHGPRLLATARRILREDGAAQDALQDGFLRAFRSLGEFRGEARLGTWLHRIVVNAALGRLRAAARHPEEPLDPLLPEFSAGGHFREAPAAWAPPPEEEVERRELQRRVRAEVDALPDSYRAVLVLRDLEGFDTEEAARLLGLTPANVKVRLHRARQALRTRLDRILAPGEGRP